MRSAGPVVTAVLRLLSSSQRPRQKQLFVTFRRSRLRVVAILLVALLLQTCVQAFPLPTLLTRPRNQRRQEPVLMATANSNEFKKWRVLGICGGIGAGKSEACRTLVEELGCEEHIDADKIGHSVYAPGSPVVDELVAEFGAEILETKDPATVDRRRLGAIVFASEHAMRKLEQIVWPHVQTAIAHRISTIQNKHRDDNGERAASPPRQSVIVVEAAVLLDAGWQDNILDAVWVIKVPRKVAIARLTSSRGLSTEEAEKRIDAQQFRRGIGNLDKEVKNGVVTAVLDNSGSAEEMRDALAAKLVDDSVWYPRAKES